jgi:anti-sigma regulatory factor (Ser/Thr protein kinase)
VTAAHLAALSPARCVQRFPGGRGQVRAARAFVARVLIGCPAQETLVTCLSELATNAIEHTASGRGGSFTVEVGQPRDGVAFVAVTDQGSQETPAARRADDAAEGGRGLALVAACSSRWGYRDTAGGRTVWAEVTWPVAVREAGASCGVSGGMCHDIGVNMAGAPSIA